MFVGCVVIAPTMLFASHVAPRTASKTSNLPREIRDGLGDWMKERRDKHMFRAVANGEDWMYYECSIH